MKKIVVIIWVFFSFPAWAQDVYDPLAIDPNVAVSTLEITIYDRNRNRDIPIMIYLPESSKPLPVVIFSHGLGGSKNNNSYLGLHWASRGYASVFVQHHGSDELVWKDKAKLFGYLALKKAANPDNFLLRVQDIPVVIDALADWNNSPDSPLYYKLDTENIAMSGHSFGAVTTQAMSGQRFRYKNANYTDTRIKAAIMFSPSIPKSGYRPKDSFEKVQIPWLLMTGTHDDSPLGNFDPESRREVFPALPAGAKYELVLYKAEHSAFGDRKLPNERQPRNPNHHRAILAISTAFLDTYLKHDPDARNWINSDAVRNVLEPDDLWQWK